MPHLISAHFAVASDGKDCSLLSLAFLTRAHLFLSSRDQPHLLRAYQLDALVGLTSDVLTETQLHKQLDRFLARPRRLYAWFDRTGQGLVRCVWRIDSLRHPTFYTHNPPPARFGYLGTWRCQSSNGLFTGWCRTCRTLIRPVQRQRAGARLLWAVVGPWSMSLAT